jgi:hypothetical protein
MFLAQIHGFREGRVEITQDPENFQKGRSCLALPHQPLMNFFFSHSQKRGQRSGFTVLKGEKINNHAEKGGPNKVKKRP